VGDFILLMHNDALVQPTPEMWSPYLSFLPEGGVFEGGSSIGAGETFRRDAAPANVSDHLAGHVRVQAEDLAEARECWPAIQSLI
jgi:hypothetical protein